MLRRSVHRGAVNPPSVTGKAVLRRRAPRPLDLPGSCGRGTFPLLWELHSMDVSCPPSRCLELPCWPASVVPRNRTRFEMLCQGTSWETSPPSDGGIRRAPLTIDSRAPFRLGPLEGRIERGNTRSSVGDMRDFPNMDAESPPSVSQAAIALPVGVPGLGDARASMSGLKASPVGLQSGGSGTADNREEVPAQDRGTQSWGDGDGGGNARSVRYGRCSR
jgi:hypothetical protein